MNYLALADYARNETSWIAWDGEGLEQPYPCGWDCVGEYNSINEAVEAAEQALSDYACRLEGRRKEP